MVYFVSFVWEWKKSPSAARTQIAHVRRESFFYVALAHRKSMQISSGDSVLYTYVRGRTSYVSSACSFLYDSFIHCSSTCTWCDVIIPRWRFSCASLRKFPTREWNELILLYLPIFAIGRLITRSVVYAMAFEAKFRKQRLKIRKMENFHNLKIRNVMTSTKRNFWFWNANGGWAHLVAVWQHEQTGLRSDARIGMKCVRVTGVGWNVLLRFKK